MLADAKEELEVTAEDHAARPAVRQTSHSRYLMLIVALALAIRMLLLFVAWRSDHAALENDSASYLMTAKSLVSDGTFRHSGWPELSRTPGYPIFLAVCGVTGPLGYGIAQFVQVLVDTLLVFLTYWLGARLVSRAAGLWAAAFHAVSVVSIIASVQILTDGVFALLLTVGILLLVKNFQDRTRWPLLLAAAVSAAAIYVRPVGFIFVPIVLVVLAFRRPRLANVLAFSAVLAAFVAPWFVRNYVVAGYPGFSSIGQYNMLVYEAAGVVSKTDKIPVEAARLDLDRDYHRQMADLNMEPHSAAAIQLQGKMARQIILSHPITFLWMHLETDAGTLLPAGTEVLQMLGITTGNRGTLMVLQTYGLWAAMKYYFGANMIAALLIIPEAVLLMVLYAGCMVFGLSQLRVRKLAWTAGGWLVVLTVAAFLLVAGPASLARFRTPVDPLLSIGGGAGLVTAFGVLRKRRQAARLLSR